MSVRTDRFEAVALLTIDRPDALNSFDAATAEALRDALDAALSDDGVRCIVLTGEGDRAFCAGADVAAFRDALGEGKGQDAVARVSGTMNEVLAAIITAPKPVLAAVNGVAAGGGLGLALACDVRIASQTARFLTAFMNVAVAPDGGTTWLLPRTVGWARAREMLLTNPVLDAKQAHDWGLVTEIVPSGDVLKRALELAGELARGPRFVVTAAKERLAWPRPPVEHLAWEREATVASAGTADFEEGIAAFFEKRRPRYE